MGTLPDVEEREMPSGPIKLATIALIGLAILAPGAAGAQNRGAPPYSHYERADYEQVNYTRRDYDRARDERRSNDARARGRPEDRTQGRRCDRGSGTLLGAIAGGLLGGGPQGRGDRGASARSIDRDC
jgi:hypothetical protein